MMTAARGYKRNANITVNNPDQFGELLLPSVLELIL